MKNLFIAFLVLSPLSAMASTVVANPCIKPAMAAVKHLFNQIPMLDPIARQPKGNGTYRFNIWEGDCSWDITVKMKINTDGQCKAVETPERDGDSANCA